MAFSESIFSQEKDSGQYWIGRIVNGDTIVSKRLKDIYVFPGGRARSRHLEAKFWRYVYKVKKVYPYAQRANELLKQYEPEYLKLKTQRERRQLVKKVEEQLMGQYKEEFKRMTISEGRIMIKLIDRETGRTSYSLIKDFRGSFSAFFWQTIAKLFSNDLKSQYDPQGDDKLLEEIVNMINAGEI